MAQTRLWILASALATASVFPGPLPAQSFRWGGTEFNAVRKISIPSGKQYSMVVTQFFHHGQIAPDGKNVVVVAQDKKLVKSRVLQVGPGDYCRLVFETAGSQRNYEVYYGGDPPAEDAVGPWTSITGLLLETRRYKQCNLNSLDSVREAFESSERIGADYVPNVRHAHNPFSLKAEPFLSRYSGYLRIPKAGKYGFMTSSQDCSFLLIDERLVVAAPGRHPPQRRARTGSRKDIQLSAGPHKFEYYHAASGPQARMVVAWEVSPKEPKPKPTAIPSELFGTGSIGRVPAGPVSLRTAKLVPDFMVNIAGDVPLPDNNSPLIGVKFADMSPKSLSVNAKVLWDFGDGQTGEGPNPVHVYLHADTYTVTMTVRRSGKPFEMTNRVYVDRPVLTPKDKLHSLDEYLPILKTYDPETLDGFGLRQLVLAYQWKADLILAAPAAGKVDDKKRSDEEKAEPDRPQSPAEARKEAEARKAEAKEYIAAAVAAGAAAFQKQSAAKNDEDLIKLARLVGPMARDQLGESRLAGQIWHGAAEKISNPTFKAECEIAAADIAASDLVNAEVARSFLEAAAAHLGKNKKGPVAGRLERVWGDYYALTGDGEAARKAYLKAETITGSTRKHIERIAWRGAHSRSTEEFLRNGDLDRAAAQLHAWETEFPADKIGGYLTLLYARYWAGRGLYDQAVASADRLLTVNPESPYIDQLLLLAADCELQRGRVDRALATLHSLVNDYPGSPLVPAARKNIAALEAKQKKTPK